MWGFLVAGAIGFVLGCRTGRERYDQVVRASGRIVRTAVEHPAVQGAAGVASAKIDGLYRGRKADRERRR